MMLGGGVERFGGGPVVVEERVFVLGQRGDGLRQARVEQGEVGGQGEQGERVRVWWGEEEDLEWVWLV